MNVLELKALPDLDLLAATLSQEGRVVDLTLDDEVRALSLCDGLGILDVWELVERSLLFDWRHVSQSSEAALSRAAMFIRLVALAGATPARPLQEIH